MVQSPAPLDTWGRLAAKVARLETALVVVSLVALLLAGTITYVAYLGVPIHFIPPGGPGLSQPGVIPDASATDYASRWLVARYTFTPATVKVAHAAVLQSLHPTLSAVFKVQAEREALEVKEKQLSSQVTVNQALVTQRSGASVTIALDATKTVWVGGQQIREEPLRADLTVEPWLSQGSPTGLIITQVKIGAPLNPPAR
jgi:hypothetical protein